MENDYSNQILDTDQIKENSKIKIYSKRAIWCFTFLFTTVFGGVLLMQNLIDIGKKKEAYSVLIFSILFTFISICIVNYPPEPKASLTYLCNMLGGLILTEHYFKKYFPQPEIFDTKKIWKPLLISILIILPFIIALFLKGA